MDIRDRISRLLHRPLVVCIAAGLFLTVACLSLFAQEPPHPTNSRLGSAGFGDTSSTAAEATALLPTIPPPPDTLLPLPLPEGVSRTAPAMPGMPAPDPDDFKTLYGYSGSYYNTTNLDNRVTVLEKSVYISPHTPTWKAFGLLRNQTREQVHITGLTARLLGSKGELLGTTTATLYVDELRPGEPGPFVIEAAIAGTSVKRIDWHVDYEFALGRPRPIVFQVDEAKVLNGSKYSLFGSFRNTSTTTIEGVRVVAAWLDSKGRVLYVVTPKIRLQTDPERTQDSMNLAGGDEEDFIYYTSDLTLGSLLQEANVTLWGISQ